MRYQDLQNGRFYWEDCFDVMKTIPDGVVDMILCDLPYGTTKASWDSVLPLNKLWEEYERVCKNNAAIVLTASQPFTSILGYSNIDLLKYSWIWEKSKASNFLLAKKQPLKSHEEILVFCKSTPVYNPQKTIGKPFKGEGRSKKGSNTELVNDVPNPTFRNDNDGDRYPRSVQYFVTAEKEGCLHPTQKPIKLFEYLIKTHTNENDLVLDNCAGSGTTAVAAINTNRRWICIEKEEKYANTAIERIKEIRV